MMTVLDAYLLAYILNHYIYVRTLLVCFGYHDQNCICVGFKFFWFWVLAVQLAG